MTGVLIPVANFNAATFTPLLPDNATDLELDLSRTLERISSLPIDITVLMDADRCPIELLPYLAWTVSVDYWNADWPEDMKRRVVKASLQLHFKKGTRSAVERIMALLGCDDGDLIEWWQNTVTPEFPNTMAPRTFKLRLPEAHPALSAQALQETLRDMIITVKPLTAWWHVEVAAAGELPRFMLAAEFGVLKDFTETVYTASTSVVDAIHTLLCGEIRQLDYAALMGSALPAETIDVMVANVPARRPIPDSVVKIARYHVDGASLDHSNGIVSFATATPRGINIEAVSRLHDDTTPRNDLVGHVATHTLVLGNLTSDGGDNEVGWVPSRYGIALFTNSLHPKTPDPAVRIARLPVPREYVTSLGLVQATTADLDPTPQCAFFGRLDQV